jgi:SIR2-like domain
VPPEPLCDRYIAGLPESERRRLAALNEPGLTRLRAMLDRNRAIAFLGAGTGVPLYPLWSAVVDQLTEAASDVLNPDEIRTCRAMSATNPDGVVEIIRERVGVGSYRESLRRLFQPRRHEETGRTWTPIQELIARCKFAGVVTTNYDAGIVSATMAVRRTIIGTGFASWTDDSALDRWRTGDVFSGDAFPILFAHGYYNEPEAIVLAISEYRRAYVGKLRQVLARLFDSGEIVWIGFSFSDQRISAVLREVTDESGPRQSPGRPPRHVAIMPWDPQGSGEPHDPGVLRSLVELQLDCYPILYPAYGGDHSALTYLLAEFADAYPPAPDPLDDLSVDRVELGRQMPAISRRTEVHWAHGSTPAQTFVGRSEELWRLDRWAADPSVRLVGVTAWGGAGKTALVTEWLTRESGLPQRRGFRGAFAWSFYEDPSAESWAQAVISWAEQTFGVSTTPGTLANRLVATVQETAVILLLDGLEVVQEGAVTRDFGRLLDQTLRTVLIQLCHDQHSGLVILTSRFPFADLEQFDGESARMLDVLPLSNDEAAVVLARSGAAWIPEQQRLELAKSVDGHALAINALAGALADTPSTDDLYTLLRELEQAGKTDARVGRVLRFYAERLSSSDIHLVALTSMFQGAMPCATILRLGADPVLGGHLDGWTSREIEVAVRQRLVGLLTWLPSGRVSAHPLVRDAFRPLVLTGAAAQVASDLVLSAMPGGELVSRDDAYRFVEVVELLLDAAEWEAADNLFRERTANGQRWMRLPAARLGARCALAFVSDETRRRECEERLGTDRAAFYLNAAGLFASDAGDLVTGSRFLNAAVGKYRESTNLNGFAVSLRNTCDCHLSQGDLSAAEAAAVAAAELRLVSRRIAITSAAYLAAVKAYAGESSAADAEFLEADEHEYVSSGHHLEWYPSYLWALFLVRSGRAADARRLATRGADGSATDERARHSRVIGLCNLADGAFDAAAATLEVAVGIFREADCLVDLAATLVDLAEQRQRVEDLDLAESHCREAIALASHRGLVPTHATALSVRARARINRFAQGGDNAYLERARDDVDHALRLATRVRRLPWVELHALGTYAMLDREGEYAAQAARFAELSTTLIPPTLEQSPLATVEATVSSGRSTIGTNRRRSPRW